MFYETEPWTCSLARSIISRNTIVRNSTSLGSIWQSIRLHYSFQSTGAHFLDFNDILPLPDERSEDLYQRLMAFVEDTLPKSHHGDIQGEA